MQEGDGCPCVLQAHCPHTSCTPDLDLVFAKTFPGKGCKTLAQGNHGVTIPGILQGMCRCGRSWCGGAGTAADDPEGVFQP